MYTGFGSDFRGAGGRSWYVYSATGRCYIPKISVGSKNGVRTYVGEENSAVRRQSLTVMRKEIKETAEDLSRGKQCPSALSAELLHIAVD